MHTWFIVNNNMEFALISQVYYMITPFFIIQSFVFSFYAIPPDVYLSVSTIGIFKNQLQYNNI